MSLPLTPHPSPHPGRGEDSNAGHWEQRWHPLRREWIVYSAHRNQRPWEGARELKASTAPSYDSQCYLCPGNKRIHGDVNPHYKDVFLFDNDHPVVGPAAPEVADDPGTLYRRRPAKGLARVVCFDPRHHVTLSDVPLDGVTKVVSAWRNEVRALSSVNGVQFVLIFENKGEMVGVSSPHPHCQIYATHFVFKNVEMELEAVERFRTKRGSAAGGLFDQLLAAELKTGLRVVAENAGAVAFVPFFARYSYEVWLFPKKRHATLATLSDTELADLAAVYQEVTRRYDLLYGLSFPYVMSLYQAPFNKGTYSDYHLHFVFLPPLRSPGLKKFPAGPEIGGGNFMCDTLPEEKAAELKAVDVKRYKPLV